MFARLAFTFLWGGQLTDVDLRVTALACNLDVACLRRGGSPGYRRRVGLLRLLRRVVLRRSLTRLQERVGKQLLLLRLLRLFYGRARIHGRHSSSSHLIQFLGAR